MGELALRVAGIIRGLETRFNARLATMETDLATTKAELATLKSTALLKFCGTWTSGASYTHGDAVTHHGSLWIAKAATTTGEPSKDFAGWQLAVKHGTAR